VGRREACELTPGGRGAICVLGIRSEAGLGELESLFQAASGKPLIETPLMKPAYGMWGANRDDTGEDVVVVRRSESELEVHCHGGEFAKQQILEGLTEKGYCIIRWPQWLADSNADGLTGDALAVLAETTTVKSTAILNWQVNGAFRRMLEQISEWTGRGQLELALGSLDRLAGWNNLAAHLVSPWKVAIAGLPNAGKSSLMNRIAGFERCIVFDLPGTTRDPVSITTAINGWPFEFTDTAGLRESDDPLEQTGAGLARDVIAGADLVLLVEDLSRKPVDNSRILIPDDPDVPVISLGNKLDLVGEMPASGDGQRYAVSALKGAGIDELLKAICRSLIPLEPEYQEAVPWRWWHFKAIERIRTCLLKGEADEAIRLCSPSAFAAP
jgi:tRNA modification GTPase